jgi:hypothetical protein
VGALGYFLEAEGIATTQISLIREHTEVIKPPRALWVPFDLGRPLGDPSDKGLQRQVLVTALDLLQASEGPVLADFEHRETEAETTGDSEPAVWACPVSFAGPADDMTDNETLIHGFRQEVSELRNWYDTGLGKTGRTSVVRFDPDSASQLLSAYVLKGEKNSGDTDMSFGVALRIAAQDLKAFYFEAVTARPGAAPPDSNSFNRWFWAETAAGRVLLAARDRCGSETDQLLRMTGKMLLVPMDQGTAS